MSKTNIKKINDFFTYRNDFLHIEDVSIMDISKTIKRSLVNINETSPLFSIILGCEIRYMENLVYADTLLQNKVQKVSKIHIGCRLCGMNVCEHKKNETDLATLLDPNIRYYGLFEFNG